MARIVALVYLLLLVGSGNSFFWCKAEKSSPRLESNLSGSCWTSCRPESAEHRKDQQNPNSGTAFFPTAEGCVDTPAYSSAITPTIQKSPKSKAAGVGIRAPHAHIIQAERLHVGLISVPPDHQLPPQQSLATLRTVSLLC